MLDGVSLDQLRTFIAAADEGSFSAAGRRLRRAQSVVSKTLADMEGQLRVKLFDRSARPPLLTDQGRALLADARVVAGGMDLFKARAKGIADGLEPELSLVVDAMFPIGAVIGAVDALRDKFPATALRLYVEREGPIVQHVLDRRSAFGIMPILSRAPGLITCEQLLTVRMTMVLSPRHPLAIHSAPIPKSILAEHVQLLHSDPSVLTQASKLRLLSPRTWVLAHLEAKLAFLRAGFGFGFMPLHIVEADLASGELVQITTEEPPPNGHVIPMSAIYRTDSPPGPAGRWIIDGLKQVGAPPPKQNVLVTAAVSAEAAPRNSSVFLRHRVPDQRSTEIRNGC
jgi:DNA-binding transcriptional LysR family regulator